MERMVAGMRTRMAAEAHSGPGGASRDRLRQR